MYWGGFFFENHAVAFCLKTMPKLDLLGVLFQELRVEGNICIDVGSRCSLLHHNHMSV